MNGPSGDLNRPRPEFLWDPHRIRLVWANEAGLAYWGEASIADLRQRWFAPDGAAATALNALYVRGSGVLSLSPQGALQHRQAAASERDGVIHFILNDLETSSGVDTPHMSDGFELAPRPLAIFDAVGALITQNEADRLCFGTLSLRDRLGDAQATAQSLGVALVDESHSQIFTLVGSEARWRVNFRRMRDPNGAVTVLAEFTDLPDLDDVEGVERRALAAIAHDFRAPLTAIRGFAEFLASGAAPSDRQADYLASIQTAATGLSALADRVVTLGAAGDSVLQLVDLNDLARSCANLNEAIAIKTGATITVRLDASAKPVLGDQVAATRIVQNLLSNALRHGGAGISIAVAPEMITIADDGGGMDQPALDAALAPYGGDGVDHGLGLSNCVELAKSMASRLTFRTAPGEGFEAELSFAP